MECLFASAFICGIIGYFAGNMKESGGTGFLLGLLFGPIGIIIALFVDGRGQCPSCGTKVSSGYPVCPGCKGRLM